MNRSEKRPRGVGNDERDIAWSAYCVCMDADAAPWRCDALVTASKAVATPDLTQTDVAYNRKLLSNRRAANGVEARMRDKMAPRHVHAGCYVT